MARFEPAFRLVAARYAQRLTLADLAGAVHLHPTYFATLFRRATGEPPLRYVTRYRLQRARDLLLASDYPLGEIARRTGFYDAPHLSRAFSASEGVPPGPVPAPPHGPRIISPYKTGRSLYNEPRRGGT